MAREIVVVIKEWDGRAQVLADCGVFEYRSECEPVRSLRVVVPDGADPKALRERLKAHPGVAIAFIDTPADPMVTRNAPVSDPYTATLDSLGGVPEHRAYLLHWGHSRIDSYRAWKEGKGDPSVKIVVNDTGWQPHEDLPTIAAENQYGMVRGAGDAQDLATDESTGLPISFGHGLMCLGVIFAKHNGAGVSGIAPDCTPGAVSVIDDYGNPTNGYYADGMVRAADMLQAGERLINSNSWRAVQVPAPNYDPNDDPENLSALLQYIATCTDYAVAKANSLVVTAAGNEAKDLAELTYFPGERPGVINVGALAPWGGKMDYSCWGAKVDIVAPTATGSLCTLPASMLPYPLDTAQKYFAGSGTSTSCPVVAGILGLIWSQNTDLTAIEVRDILFSTVSPFLDADCETVYFPGNNRYGFPRGVANEAKGVLKAKATRAENRGKVFPYVGFFGQHWTQDDPAPTDYRGTPPRAGTPAFAGTQTVWHDKDEAGKVTTYAKGEVWVDVTGYSFDAGGTEDPVETVSLYCDDELVYTGPPDVVHFADGLPTASSVTVEVETVGGVTAAETYDDVAVISSSAETLAPVVDPITSPTADDPILLSGRVPSYLSAELAASASVGASLTAQVAHRLSASLSVSATLAASLTAPRPLAASLSCSASVVVDLTVGAGTATRAPVVDALQSPIGTAIVTISGTVPGAQAHPLLCELAASASLGAALQLPTSHPLVAEILATGSVVVDLTHPQAQPLAAELVGTATLFAMFGVPYTGPRRVKVSLAGPTASLSIAGPAVRMYLDEKG